MKITFIFPAIGREKKGGHIPSWLMEPLSIAVLSALTPDGIEKVFYDDRIDNIPYEDETDLVAINVETYTAKRAYQISAKYRSKGVPVVMGGPHAALIPDELMENADIVAVGCADSLWDRIVNDVWNGSYKKVYYAESASFFTDKIPDRGIYKKYKYRNLKLVQTSRGCKFTCSHCASFGTYKTDYFTRPIEYIVNEIQSLKSKRVFLIDDNLVIDRERSIELFKALIPLKISWIGQLSMHIYEDDELLSYIRKSGCLGLLVGFEALKDDGLKEMNKPVNLVADGYEKVISQFYKHKICLFTSFVLGYDLDDEEKFENVYQFSLKHKIFYTGYNHLTPFPNTPIYNSLKEQNRLLYDKWWLKDGFRYGDIVFKPAKMTPEKLRELCYKYRYGHYNLKSILTRALNFRVNMQNLYIAIIYLGMNLISKHDTTTRRGFPLGSMLDD